MKPSYMTHVIRVGKHFGRTIHQIARKDPDWVVWLAGLQESKRGFTRRDVAAARAYIASPYWERLCPVVGIPRDVLIDRALSLGAKVLFGVLWTEADQDAEHRCRLSNDGLCDQSSLSPRQVKTLLADLERRS